MESLAVVSCSRQVLRSLQVANYVAGGLCQLGHVSAVNNATLPLLLLLKKLLVSEETVMLAFLQVCSG